MKLLIVVPGFAPPWTEGCKNFVRDLIPELQGRVDLSVLSATTGPAPVRGSIPFPVTYIPARHKPAQLFIQLKELKRHLSGSNRPNIVVHFPYGTFGGLRGLVNTHSVIQTHRLVRRAGIPCVTVLYSMSGGSLSWLRSIVPAIATVSGEGWPGYVVNPGIRIPAPVPAASPARPGRNLLFMAGYHENKPSLVKNILRTRGLLDVVRIGESLGRNGFRLTIAAPIFRHPHRRAELMSWLTRESPSLPVSISGEVDVYELFQRHSLYLFPYRQNHHVFIPTSILEAMASGIPVVASDLPMFRPLMGSDNRFGYSYPAGNAEGLFRTILDAHENREDAAQRAISAARHVRREWTIQRSAEQLLGIADRLVAS